jgi:hypothetical protein
MVGSTACTVSTPFIVLVIGCPDAISPPHTHANNAVQLQAKAVMMVTIIPTVRLFMTVLLLGKYTKNKNGMQENSRIPLVLRKQAH